ncbi:GDSL esterase/lipase APG-like [Miscanthus floridulus]|uniref:GDSL esterase/lipase APG-like n=1 Tax=Miscanthus floridulus TaxID=154761 RepID=UPI0034575AB7
MGTNDRAVISLVLFLVCMASRSLGTTETEAVVEQSRSLVPSIYVFGDSIVDVGNNDFLPPPAPRARFPYGIDFAGTGMTGRFTNGYNLADLVARRLGFMKSPPAYLSLTPLTNLDLLKCRVGANYASGGSGILNTTGNGTLTLQKQIMLFSKTKARMWRCGRKLNYMISKSFFLISAGGNDFSAFSEMGMGEEDAPAYISSMVSTYVEHINALYKLGARRLGILDVPAIGCTPGSRVPMANGGCNDAANSMAQNFNKLLRLEVATAVATSMPDMKYSIASTYNFLTDLMDNHLVAGIPVVEMACCGSGKLNAVVMCSKPNTTYCSHRDDYMFWDMLHPTQATYERGVLAIFYGLQEYADPINFAGLVNNATDINTTMTPSVSAI